MTLTAVAGAGLIGTGVIMYGAYRGANHMCKQMVSTVDGEGTVDSENKAAAAGEAAVEDSGSSGNDGQAIENDGRRGR